MCRQLKKQRESGRMRFLVPLLLIFINLYVQPAYSQNNTLKIPAGTFIQIRDSVSFFSKDTLLKLPSSLIAIDRTNKERNLVFYDSLKVKASKNLITRKLYDFVIVTPDTINTKKITDNSDASYLTFSGKKIRKISIQRLDVFGVNINNPALTDRKQIENILNKTHVNTNENIIRKNLLFGIGDTISPLTLSDNERILRQLSFIDDARIIVVPVSDEEADVVVLTKDVYSLGGSLNLQGLEKGAISVYEKNIIGIGHELNVMVPFDTDSSGSPGFGANYLIDNIWKSFFNMNLYYYNGLGNKNYGFILSRNLVSSTSKYAGGLSVRRMHTTEDLDSLQVPEPLKYNLQDYWIERAFLINKESVSRIIVGARYTNNNVFERPFILPDSYYHLQKYRIFLGSAALSIQKYYKTNLIYSYGRTEDIPYGGLLKITMGREINEFSNRTYLGAEFAVGKSSKALGYFYASAGIGSFLNESTAEQGIVSINLNYFSNIVSIGNHLIRNFVYIDYTRGFNRKTDEFLGVNHDNGFSGFKNDSLSGNQRLSVNLESVLFSPLNLYGFRFAFFGFSDLSLLSWSKDIIRNDYTLSGIGIGIRIRNDNMVFNTFQVRLGFYPNPPSYSRINHLIFSGEQLLSPNNFDSGPPSIISYR